jgi:hypothetical protein
MFYKRVGADKQHFEFLAVLSITVDRERHEKAVYGQMHTLLHLANNTKVPHVFERDQWNKLTARIEDGGLVING